jgi:hypothetical protein
VGYKAGNLRYSFNKIKGEYVAYFDADHRPEGDFLQNVMPYFFTQAGETKNEIALVQTPWAYYNIHQNLLTEYGEFENDRFRGAIVLLPIESLTHSRPFLHQTHWDWIFTIHVNKSEGPQVIASSASTELEEYGGDKPWQTLAVSHGKPSRKIFCCLTRRI